MKARSSGREFSQKVNSYLSEKCSLSVGTRYSTAKLCDHIWNQFVTCLWYCHIRCGKEKHCTIGSSLCDVQCSIGTRLHSTWLRFQLNPARGTKLLLITCTTICIGTATTKRKTFLLKQDSSPIQIKLGAGIPVRRRICCLGFGGTPNLPGQGNPPNNLKALLSQMVPTHEEQPWKQSSESLQVAHWVGRLYLQCLGFGVCVCGPLHHSKIKNTHTHKRSKYKKNKTALSKKQYSTKQRKEPCLQTCFIFSLNAFLIFFFFPKDLCPRCRELSGGCRCEVSRLNLHKGNISQSLWSGIVKEDSFWSHWYCRFFVPIFVVCISKKTSSFVLIKVDAKRQKWL